MTDNNHPSNCTGCPTCNPEFRALLSMTPSELADWQNRRTMRTAAAHRVFRVTEPRKTDPDEPPNPYQAALDCAPLVLTPDLDPRYEPYGQPPDGYMLALAHRQALAERNEK
jgi:hypothetical protein